MVENVAIIFKRILILVIIFQIIFMPISNATSFWDEIKDSGDTFIENGKSQSNNETSDPGISESELQTLIKKIYNLLLALGVVISVLIGAAIGIKYIISSVDEQAKTKELLMPYVVGNIVTFGAFGIWKILMTVLGTI